MLPSLSLSLLIRTRARTHTHLADDVLQRGGQVGELGREDRVRQVEAREQLIAVGDLGQVAVGGQHDAGERVGRALLGALLLEEDLGGGEGVDGGFDGLERAGFSSSFPPPPTGPPPPPRPAPRPLALSLPCVTCDSTLAQFR